MATTINAANIAIGYDGSKLKIGIDGTRAEIAKLQQNLRASMGPTFELKQQIQFLTTSFAAGAVTTEAYTRTLKHLREELARVEANSKKAAGGGMLGSLKSFVGVYAIYAGVKEMFRLTAEVEQASIAFEVLIGNGKKAADMIVDMKELDARSALNFVDIAQAGKILLGYGVVHQQVMPLLNQLGAISLGNNDKFRSLALAMGQVNAAGRLMGQEVLQMVNAGFNPLQQISYSTGRSMVELKEAMQNGEISVQMVTDALTDATSAGGRFFEMNERLANSAQGAYNKMVSAIQMAAVEIGTELIPVMKEMADLVATLAKSPIKDVAVGAAGGAATTSNFFADMLNTNVMAGENPFTRPFELMAERMRMAAAADADAVINERDYDRRKAAEAIQEEANAIALKRDNEIKLANDKNAFILDALEKEKEAARIRLIGERENEIMKLQQSLNTVGLVAEEELRVRLALEETIRLKRKNWADEDEDKRAKEREEVRQRAEEDQQEAKIRDMKEARDEFKDIETENAKFSNLAPLLKAGSVEAYKFMAKQGDEAIQKKMLDKVSEQVKKMDDEIKVEKDILEELKKQNRVVAIR